MSDAAIRLSAFLGIMVLMAVLEAVFPRREREISRRIRWPRNLGIIVIDNIFVRFLGPLAAGAVALFAEEKGIGLFNWLDLSAAISIPLTIIVFDLAIYWQHVIFHRVPVLWRLHMVHHIDQEIDVTTGIRFHPVEIVLSMLIKAALVLALGAPFWGIVAFEVLLNAGAMFSHANFKLPLGADRVLRKLIVTPDMHRVHHSVCPNETHSNFGFQLSIWDRLFGTYIDQPKDGHEEMTIGLPSYQDSQKTSLVEMLILPFRRR